ncbi:Negative regulator of differentiation 1 [Beauveria bassiana]|nr:Negative regulator of differentiation 1 [Beauveria bassiana]
MSLSPPTSPLRRSQIRIDRDEYDRLRSVASKYENLCQHLIRGGVDTDTIEILSKSHDSQSSETEAFDSFSSPDDEQSDSSIASTIVTYRGSPYSAGGPLYAVTKHTSLAPESDSESEIFSDSAISHDQSSLNPDDSASVVATRHTYEQSAKRTLQLGDLPPNISRADVVAVVRGGPVADIYFNLKERRAVVSFVHGEHARKYYNYAQETGVYIRGSLIKVTWALRQFILAPYVSQQLRGGASRNLVIRHYDRRITADSIRADLEHIHNLAVVSIELSGLDCYIGINSITAASFARTCMMSRYPYRGSRIEWAPDECMQSLSQLRPKTGARAPMSRAKTNLNRFSLLEIGGEKDM